MAEKETESIQSKIIPFPGDKDKKFVGNVEYIKSNAYNKDKKTLSEVGIMDNNTLLEKYIEKMDRDQSDLRRDIQISEERTSKKLSETEQRMDERLNRIEDMFLNQSDKISSLYNHVTKEFRDNRKFMWGITISIIALVVAAIIGIAQIVGVAQ